MLRTLVSGTLLATTALVGAVNSSAAWPRFADLRAADHDLIVPVQMRGGGGMAGGGMAGAGGMAGGGMAGGVAKGGMGAGAKGDIAGAKGGMAGTGAKGTAGAGAKGGMAGAGAKGTAGAKGGTVGKGGGGTAVARWQRRRHGRRGRWQCERERPRHVRSTLGPAAVFRHCCRRRCAWQRDRCDRGACASGGKSLLDLDERGTNSRLLGLLRAAVKRRDAKAAWAHRAACAG